MDGSSGSLATGAGKAPKPFLRRGEGVEKRVFASRYRKAITPVANASESSKSGFDGGANGDVVTATSRKQPGSSALPGRPRSNPWTWEGTNQELAADSHLIDVDHAAEDKLDSAPIGNRFLRNSLTAAWATQQAEEELELEEFRALETQIKADVVGGGRQRQEQAVPQALPSTCALLHSAPNVRSYAAIHQQRPTQPSQRASNRSAPSSPGPARMTAGWPSPNPSHKQRYNDAAEADGYSDDNSYAEGFGGAGTGADGASTWGPARLVSSPGKPSFGAAAAATAAQDGGAWGLDGGAAAGSLSPGRSGAAGGGFNDLDAWNDTSSFFGSAPAGVRKGAGVGANASASRVKGGRAHGGVHSPGAAAQLEDPWAAPVGCGNGEGAFQDDCNAWCGDQQRKATPVQQQQQGLGSRQPAEEEAAPDQAFVRALFSKQRQQQPGTGRKPAQGAGGKAKAAEPKGPSAAEIERMQALEEQLASVSTERSTLVRMRTELEKAANRLEQERQAWEKSRADEQARWEAQREAEESKLRRDRRVLEKQSKALLKLPNKKERTAMEAAEAALEAERREGRAREARHKLTVERLRRQLVELQERNHELREEVRWHEAQQLERGWPQQGQGGKAGQAGQQQQQPTKPRAGRTIAVQTDPLPFLPSLDGAVAPSEPPGAVRPGTAAATAAGGGNGAGAQRQLAGGAAVAAAGNRPKSSGSALPTGGMSAGGPGSRLRAMQTARLSTTQAPAQPPAQQQRQQQLRQSAWRSEGFGQGSNRSGGSERFQRWEANGQDNDDDAEALDLDEEEAERGEELQQQQQQGHSVPFGRRGLGQQQAHAGRPSAASSSWWQGSGGDQTDGAEEAVERAYPVGHDMEEDTDEAEEASGRKLESTSRRATPGRGGVYGRGGGADAAAAAPAGAASPSAFSYTQNDDAEVLTDEGGAADDYEGGAGGLDADSLSALAWQQHQEFMARMGLAPDGGTPSQPSSARAAFHTDRTHRVQEPPHQQQLMRPGQGPQQHSQRRYPGAGAGDGEGVGLRPGPSGRQPPPPQQQQYEQHGMVAGTTRPARPNAAASSQQRPQGGAGDQSQQQQQQQPQRRSGSGPGLGAGAAHPYGAHSAAAQAAAGWSAQDPSGSGSRAGITNGGEGTGAGGQLRSSAFFTGGATTGSVPSVRGDRGVMGAAATAGGVASIAPGGAGGQRFGEPSGAAQGQGPGMRRGPGAAAATSAADPWDSIGDLGGVSETLAALRLDRHVGAAAAAAGRGGGQGPCYDGPAASEASLGFIQGARQQQQQPARQPRNSDGPGGGVMRGGGGARRDGDGWSPKGVSGCAQAPAGCRPMQSAAAAWDAAALEVPDSWTRGDMRVSGGALRHSQHFPQAQRTQQQPFLHDAQEPTSQPRVPGGYGSSGVGQGGASATTAANAASVAHSVAARHLNEVPDHAAAAVAGRGVDAMAREVRYSDGKVERTYASGKRLVHFANGTRKVALSDGTSRVYFTNGDVKWTVPDAAAATRGPDGSPGMSTAAPPPPGISVVHYYYAEVETWHSTYGGEGGVEVFYFPSGQTEAHHPGHGKEILYPDGVLRVVTSDGEQLNVTWQQLSWAIQQSQPRVEGLGDDEL